MGCFLRTECIGFAMSGKDHHTGMQTVFKYWQCMVFIVRFISTGQGKVDRHVRQKVVTCKGTVIVHADKSTARRMSRTAIQSEDMFMPGDRQMILKGGFAWSAGKGIMSVFADLSGIGIDKQIINRRKVLLWNPYTTAAGSA